MLLTLLFLALTICTIVHMWKRVDVSTGVKILLALAFIFVPLACIAWWIYYFIKKPAVMEKNVSDTAVQDEPDSVDNTQSSNRASRWSVSGMADLFDERVFKVTEKEGYKESSFIFVWAVRIGILVGVSIVIAILIDDHSTYPIWAASIGGGIILAMSAVYAINDIKLFQTGGQIAGRLAYLILMPLLLASIAGILAAVIVMIVVVVLILSVVFRIILGSNDKVKLRNGDVVSDLGVFGWIGKSGNKYSKNLDGTFTQEN